VRIEVMPKSPKEIAYTFQEIPFQYDWDEYQQWITGNVDIRDRLLNITGYLGQKEATYYNQLKQHYPEVKFAGYLVNEEEFNKNLIIYEKFRLSHKFLNGQTAVSYYEFLEAYALLRYIFSDKFFLEFDRLCELNNGIIRRKDTIYKICVDLCAINYEKKQVHFYEIKKYKLRGDREEINPDQLLVLAFVHYIIKYLGKKAFSQNKIYTIKTALIALVAKNDERRLDGLQNNPEKYYHRGTFSVQKEDVG
jgi:hypothetical protein